MDSLRVKQFFFLGIQEKMKGDWKKAEGFFRTASLLHVKEPAVQYELAQTLFKQKDFEAASAYITEAIALRPDNKYFLSLQLDILKQRGNANDLLPVLEQLIVLEPHQEKWYADKAQVLWLKGDTALNGHIKIIKAQFGNPRWLLPFTQAPKVAQSPTPDVHALMQQKAALPLYLQSAFYWQKQQRLDIALPILQEARRMEPQNHVLGLAMANIYMKQNQWQGYAEAIAPALNHTELGVEDKISLLMPLFKQMQRPEIEVWVQKYTQQLSAQHPNEPKILGLYADALNFKGQFKEAAVQYEQALALDNRVYTSWIQLLMLYNELGEYAKALETADRAMVFFKEGAELYHQRAISLLQLKNYKDAIKQLKIAAELNKADLPMLAQVYALHGDVLLNQGAFHQSKKMFELAIQTDSSNYLIKNNYAYYLALKEEELQRADMLAELAYRAAPTNASILDTRAFVLFKRKQWTLALSFIEQALAIEGDNAVFLEHHGDILYKMGQVEAAMQQWKAAMILAPNDKLNQKINEKKYIK